MENQNYFTLYGLTYQGNFEQAFTIYQHSKLYNTFSDYLKDNYTQITEHKVLINQIEKDFFAARLKENNYNVTKTSRLINISRVQLCNKIVSLKIEMPENRKLNYIQYKPVKK